MEMMQTNKNFSELVKTANDIQAACSDISVKAKKVKVNPDLTINLDGSSNHTMSQLAKGHLCGKLDVPSRYISRLADAGYGKLAADNLNTWLKADDREFFFRKYDDSVRGVLSSSYSVYDATEILKSVSDVLDMSKFKTKGWMINEERLHLRMVESEMMDVDDEDLFAGISLDSSDVGRSGLKVKFFVWKQVCSNGLIIPQRKAELFRQKHIGITTENFKERLEAGLEQFNEVKGRISEIISETKQVPLDDDIDKIIEEVKESTRLDDDSITEVIDFMVQKYDRTQWGLINGITEVAQKFDLERQLELESIAGEMLWKR